MSLKKNLEKFLKEKNYWISGGEIETMTFELFGHKPSTASRVCRSMANENILEHRYNDKGYVEYRYKGRDYKQYKLI